MEVGGELKAPAALSLETGSGTYWKGEYVYHRARLDASQERKKGLLFFLQGMKYLHLVV
jgi:hypothetical protein